MLMDNGITIKDYEHSVKVGEKNERLFKRRFSQKLKKAGFTGLFRIDKLDKDDDIDFILYLKDEHTFVPSLGIEYKERNISSEDYLDYPIRDRKVKRARHYEKEFGINSIVVMRFLVDGKELFWNIKDWSEVKSVTRRDRGVTRNHMFYHKEEAIDFDDSGIEYIFNELVQL